MLETTTLPGRQRSLNIYGISLDKSKPIDDLLTPGHGYNASLMDIKQNEIFTIITTDIETTGITNQSQMRTVSYLKRRARYNAEGILEYVDDRGNVLRKADGTISKSVNVADARTIHLPSTRMNQAQVYGTNEYGNRVLMPLGEYAVGKEALGGDLIIGGPRNNLASLGPDATASDIARAQADELTRVLNDFTGYDEATKTMSKVRLQGHNIANFDSKFFTTHMLALHEQIEGGLGVEHREALQRFMQLRADNPFYIVDTMNSALAAVSRDAAEIEQVLRNKGINDNSILRTIHDALLDKTIRDKASITGERSRKNFRRKLSP